ncbi:MAG TPA: FAD-binding protein [Solirubrobacteraceae bacterium]|jgi:D-arabinono-1,4-lactone oxidase|nr:FAD-binding protein [Solirubrobacteraceae bacterium]
MTSAASLRPLQYPQSEADVVALVRAAAASGRQLRVRGSGHSPAAAIGADRSHAIELSLDRYRAWWVLDEERRLIEVQAGINLGRDPSHPRGEATVERSLLWQLWHERGWALSITGGITHQTVAGFLSTGSSGGSTRHSLTHDVVAVRIVDGRGEVHVLSRDDEDRGAFDAVLPSMGLLGVISTVTFQCIEAFTISGQEAITIPARSAVDVFGPGGFGRPSLEDFLRGVEYTRLEWWPQRGAERLLIWQAQRTRPEPGFLPVRYEQFTAWPLFAEPLIGLLYTLFGNLEDLEHAQQVLREHTEHLDRVLARLSADGHLRPRGRALARALGSALRTVARSVPALQPLTPALQRAIPRLFPMLLDLVLPVDTHKRGMHHREPQAFSDWSWHGLPMDNQASDVLLATEFTELWSPLPRAGEVVRLVREYFAAPADSREAYGRTGLYAYELYAAPPHAGWLHPGHSNGHDEWRDGAFRLDVYWYAANAADPHETFFPQFWRLLRDHGIPFRLHWGKHLPGAWTDQLAAQYPRWMDWLALRARMDPDGVFLTDYWRDHLGV